MAVNLQKGGNVSLTKEAPTMTKMLIGLGWAARATDGAAFDLDASAFLLGGNGKVRGDTDFVFYNQPKTPDGSVEYGGDNQTGDSEGDDETIVIDLSMVPADVTKIAISVTIHEAETRRQNFGMVSNAYVRCVNMAGDQEVARYDLSEDASVETAMLFGEVYRNGSDWKFRAVGQGYAGGLKSLALNYGVKV